MSKRRFKTIKVLVFDEIHRSQGRIKYCKLEEQVLKQFPSSAFKKTHWSWYRNQCTKGKYAYEFSDIEKENLRRFPHSKRGNHSPIYKTSKKILQCKESPEINAIEIDTNVLDVVHDVIKSALAYERMTDNARKIGITGEVGEILACYHLGLRLCIDPRAAGFDAIDNKGKRVQIKTRRSETEGLPMNAGRLGTFSKHPFDYALLVLLDREYHVAEIWKADYVDVMPLIEKQKKRNPNLSVFKKVSQRIWRTY